MVPHLLQKTIGCWITLRSPKPKPRRDYSPIISTIVRNPDNHVHPLVSTIGNICSRVEPNQFGGEALTVWDDDLVRGERFVAGGFGAGEVELRSGLERHEKKIERKHL